MLFNSSFSNFNSILAEMEPFCSNSLLWKLAFDSKFVVRARDLQPQMLLLAALQVMDHPSEISIEALYTLTSHI